MTKPYLWHITASSCVRVTTERATRLIALHEKVIYSPSNNHPHSSAEEEDDAGGQEDDADD